MIDNKYLEKITDYIENTLSNDDKIDFESYMNQDLEFKKIINDIKYNTLALKKLENIEGSSDFVYKLNKRIDEYENSIISNSFYNSIRSIFSKSDSIALLTGASLIVILSFSFFKFSNLNEQNTLVNTNNFDDSIAINDSDSLNVDNPVLLLGNDK
tara:strand:+ start:899 stop:1366 length:468 start_codon:yes stop_codon:yes gene_type:complete